MTVTMTPRSTLRVLSLVGTREKKKFGSVSVSTATVSRFQHNGAYEFNSLEREMMMMIMDERERETRLGIVNLFIHPDPSNTNTHKKRTRTSLAVIAEEMRWA